MHFPGVALVTGAGSGIGRATARLFAKEGCRRLAIADLNSQGLEETKRQIDEENRGTQVLAIPTDVTSEESVQSMVLGTVKLFGRLDYACNVAGALVPGRTTEYTVTQWEKQMSVNARGAWLCQRAELLQMLKQDALKAEDSLFEARGAIANVSSTGGLRGFENIATYCASKFAVIGISKSDGLQYAKDRIRVNAVCPGIIQTPMIEGVSTGSGVGDQTEREASDIAMGRRGRPEEVAEALVWIVSGRASFVTATTLVVGGGVVA